MLDSLRMAFSLYSIIPVPPAEWNEKSMKYCICFLPLVGGVIGTVQYLAFKCMAMLSFGDLFRGAVLSVLPVLITGGIHLDGFLDTCDAIHSYGSREKRLEILKDPHVGAFALIGGCVWFVLWLGVWAEAGEREILPMCLIFVLSRAMSAYAALTFPKARKDGMLRGETDPAAKGASTAMAAASVLTAAAIVLAGLLSDLFTAGNAAPADGLRAGGTVPFSGCICAASSVVTAAAALIYYRRMSEKQFGGTTGDLAGWFTQVCELAAAGAVVVMSHILG